MRAACRDGHLVVHLLVYIELDVMCNAYYCWMRAIDLPQRHVIDYEHLGWSTPVPV